MTTLLLEQKISTIVVAGGRHASGAFKAIGRVHQVSRSDALIERAIRISHSTGVQA